MKSTCVNKDPWRLPPSAPFLKYVTNICLCSLHVLWAEGLFWFCTSSHETLNAGNTRNKPISSTIFFGCTPWLAGSQLPDQGLNPRPPQWKPWILITGCQGLSCRRPSLEDLSSQLIHVEACIRASFLSKAESSSPRWAFTWDFPHSLVSQSDAVKTL